jgi:endonuclease YncB( thermonuclease family)
LEIDAAGLNKLMRSHRQSFKRTRTENYKRHGRIGTAARVASWVVAAGAIGAIAGAATLLWPRIGQPAYDQTVSGCRVVDGDTLNCGGERIRLLGIDAPELPGHCRKGRACAPGDPYASTDSLKLAISGSLGIQRVGTDHYGRTLAIVGGDNGDLSCWQLRTGQAIYKAKWDNGMRVARSCPRDVL